METQENQEGENGNNNNEETTVAEITSTQGFGPTNQLEQTLAIIKPDAIDKADEIISVIHREGFAVLQVCIFISEYSHELYNYAVGVKLFNIRVL